METDSEGFHAGAVGPHNFPVSSKSISTSPRSARPTVGDRKRMSLLDVGSGRGGAASPGHHGPNARVKALPGIAGGTSGLSGWR